jgi:hypothetical protein
VTRRARSGELTVVTTTSRLTCQRGGPRVSMLRAGCSCRGTWDRDASSWPRASRTGTRSAAAPRRPTAVRRQGRPTSSRVTTGSCRWITHASARRPRSRTTSSACPWSPSSELPAPATRIDEGGGHAPNRLARFPGRDCRRRSMGSRSQTQGLHHPRHHHQHAGQRATRPARAPLREGERDRGQGDRRRHRGGPQDGGGG